MNITFITYIYPYPKRGFNPGIERVIGEISHALANKGHRVNIITTYRNGGQQKEEKDGNVNIYRINDLRNIFGRIGSIFSLDLLSINHFAKEYNYIFQDSDIIHAFTPFFINFPNVPLVSHFHHDEKIRNMIEYLYVPTSKYFWTKAYKKSNAVVSVSKYSAKYLEKIGVSPHNIFVVPNGVDISKFHPQIDTNKLNKRFDANNVLLFVGPLTRRKGLEYLIKALPKVLEKHADTILVLVGGGDPGNLKQLVDELGIHSNVVFEGFVSDEELPMYYNSCDFFVFPSLQEGFGMVLIEAMACGKTVVASNNTAIPEVVGDAGLLVEPENTDAMADAIIYLLNNASERNILGMKALNRSHEKYTWGMTANNLLDLYRTQKDIVI